jgi:hypothetical protein
VIRIFPAFQYQFQPRKNWIQVLMAHLYAFLFNINNATYILLVTDVIIRLFKILSKSASRANSFRDRVVRYFALVT